MRIILKNNILIYRDSNGKEPFTDWLISIKDITIRARIKTRLDRVMLGNLGDYKSISNDVFELRLAFGPGFRIYFGKIKNQLVILLCGGDKASQKKDIEIAKKYWQNYKDGEKNE